MIQQIPIGGFDNNFSYFIGDGASPKIAIVDPANVDHLLSEIQEASLEPSMILLTHSHHDHVEGVKSLVERFGIPVYMHSYARARVEVQEGFVVEIDDGEKLRIGGLEIKIMYTPGHIDDAVCYLIEEGEGAPGVITGDTLFVEGCGRADFEDSNVEDLWKSLQKIIKLGDEVKIYPGHDYGSMPVSTVGWEKENNKYLRCRDFTEFKKLRLGE